MSEAAPAATVSREQPEEETDTDRESGSPSSTREHVLSEPEYERLLIGAGELGGSEAMESRAAILIMGRLGLRGGEMTHLDGSWVDLRGKMLSIPVHDPCTKGRGGGPCGSCRQAARQRVTHGDERSVDDILEDYWQPKTSAAVRDIPFDFSTRVEVAIRLLVGEHGGWPHSFSTLQRRIQDAADAAPGLDGWSAKTHALRGTAATYHAGNGVEKEPLKALMGWRSDEVHTKYLAVNGAITQRALRKVYR